MNLRMIFDTKKKDISLKIKITDPTKFDFEKNQLKGGASVAHTNLLIQQILHKANKIINDANLAGEKLTAVKFERLFLKPDANDNSFTEFAEDELKLMIGRVDVSYYTHVKSALTKLKEFRDPVLFSDMNYDFLSKFERHMIVKRGNNLNTVTSTLKRIKTLMTIAVKKGKISKNPLSDYKMKSEPTNRTFLTLDELKRLNEIYDGKLLPPYFQNVLQHFLFSCYVGLRYADIHSLTFEQIEKDQGEYYIILDQHKTSERVYIPLKKRAKELIGEIDGKSGLVFRVNTNQVTNRFLKEIMKAAVITKPVSFHTARHTFATLALSLGIDLKTVSSLLGHTDVKTTQIYAKVLLSSKSAAMAKFDNI